MNQHMSSAILGKKCHQSEIEIEMGDVMSPFTIAHCLAELQQCLSVSIKGK